MLLFCLVIQYTILVVTPSRMERVISIFTRWKPTDCKAALMASAKRAQMARNKVLVQQRKIEKEIADFLAQGRDEKARIKAETLLHLQKQETAFDILETLTDLIQTRMQYISESSDCPPDLVTPLASIIYASKRLQIPEFKTALRQFNAKYGVSFTSSHADNDSGQVASNLVEMLTISPPKEGEVYDLLVYVAQKNNVEWVPPARPQTVAERNKDADPLMTHTGLGTVIGGMGPIMVSDHQLSPSKPEKADETNKAPNVDDPQYGDLMDRLRKLNNDNNPKGN